MGMLRRSPGTSLVFIGNAGIVAFIILMILYVRAGLAAPSLSGIGVVLGVILIFVVLIKLKVVDRFTDGITGLARREHAVPYLLADELLYQANDYGVARIAIREKDGTTGLELGETGLVERGATILAIATLPPLPPLPCYGVSACFARA